MSRYDDRETVSLSDRLDRIEQGEEILSCVHVLLAMRTDKKVALRRHAELFQDAGALDFRHVVPQHLPHRRPGLDYRVGFQPFGKKIAACVLAIGKIDVAHVVDDFSVDLLRSALAETAVARLHVENRDLPPLCRDARKAPFLFPPQPPPPTV